MEFKKAKGEIWKPLSGIIVEYITQQLKMDEEIKVRDILKDVLVRMDDSISFNQFLGEASKFCNEIRYYSKKTHYSKEQSRAMRSVISGFSCAIVYLLTNMYDREEYEKELFYMEQIQQLAYNPIFIIGIVLIKEDVQDSECIKNFLREDLKYNIDLDAVRFFIDQAISNKILCSSYEQSTVKKQLADNTIYKDIVFDVLKGSCRRVIGCALILRDLYLKILMEYFNEDYADDDFVVIVNILISPDTSIDASIENGIDQVITERFAILPDILKNKIVEQCTYHDISIKETSFEKVLVPIIRRHIYKIIQTMWLSTEKEYIEKQKMLKYHSIDCAYVLARLRKLVDSGSTEEIKNLKNTKVKNSHDDGCISSPIFNILLSGIHVLFLNLENEKIKIHFYGEVSKDNPKKRIDTPCEVQFELDDWKLEKLDKKLQNEKILEKVIGYYNNPNGSDFRYSLVYLDNYRGIDRVSVSFDQCFSVWVDEKTFLLREKEGALIKNFYGKNILSLTGFVGKNGAGKTSITDFLRDSFPHICNDLYSEKLCVKDGVVDIEPSMMSMYRLKEGQNGSGTEPDDGTHFFVVFYFCGIYYYLTNIKFYIEGSSTLGFEDATVKRLKLRKPKSVHAYQIGKRFPIHNGNRKIVYFSQFLLPAGIAEAEVHQHRAITTLSSGESETGELSEIQSVDSSQNWEDDIIDLTEESFNSARKPLKERDLHEPRHSLNASLVMQLLFYYSEKENLKHYFKEDFSVEDLVVKSPTYLRTVSVSELKGATLENIVQDPMAYIWPFSSGQYSKYVLLSRLFWCIKGWMIFPEVFAERLHEEGLVFAGHLSWSKIRDESVRRYLRQTDSAILFFDEADAYYHPDWQRGFVQDILNMIEQHSVNPVQVIFTTNSPLMLSDLRQEDIYLMKQYGNKSSDCSTVSATEDHHPSIPTFGQNIHTLMAKPFFLDRTIGKFADQRIKWLIGLLTNTADIVEFFRDKKPDDEAANIVKEQLRQRQGIIYAKAMAILEAVQKSDQDIEVKVQQGEVREDGQNKKKRTREIASQVEKDYVASEIRNKFFKDEAMASEKTFSSDCIYSILKNHIKLIGEEVLRNELLDMYNDFISRVMTLSELDAQIEQYKAELDRLEVWRKRVSAETVCEHTLTTQGQWR